MATGFWGIVIGVVFAVALFCAMGVLIWLFVGRKNGKGRRIQDGFMEEKAFLQAGRNTPFGTPRMR